MVEFRGRGAVAARTELARCVSDDGAPGFQIGGCLGRADLFLRAVQSYKHVGSILTMSGNLVLEARHRASSALNAYGPIAATLLSTASVSLRIKHLFSESPVFPDCFIMFRFGPASQDSTVRLYIVPICV